MVKKMFLGIALLLVLIPSVSAISFRTVYNSFTTKLDYYNIDAENITNATNLFKMIDNNTFMKAGNLSRFLTNGTNVWFTWVGINTTTRTADFDLNGTMNLIAQSAPSTPSSNNLKFYAEVTQGHTRATVMDDDGIEFVLNRDNVFIARNTYGSTIRKGQAVYISGSTGNVPNVGLAIANDSTKLPAVGIAVENITNNLFGNIMLLGILTAFDTSAHSVGDRLYVSATEAGNLTHIQPIHPNFVQRMGSVLVSGVGNGAIYVTTAPFVGGEVTGTIKNFTSSGLITANNFSGNLSWNDLYNYPVECPAGTAITQLNDSVTCSTFLTTDTDTKWDINTSVLTNNSGVLTTNDSAFVKPDSSPYIRNSTNANLNLICVNCTSAVKTDALYVKGTINATGDLLTGSNWFFPQDAGNIYSGTSKVLRFSGTGIDDGGNTRGFTLRVGSGAPTQPPYQFAGDTQTGLFSPGFENVSMTAGGIEVFRANSKNQTITYGNAIFNNNATINGVLNASQIKGEGSNIYNITDALAIRNDTNAVFTRVNITGNTTVNDTLHVNKYIKVGTNKPPKYSIESDGNMSINGSTLCVNSLGGVGINTCPGGRKVEISLTSLYLSNNYGLFINDVTGTARTAFVLGGDSVFAMGDTAGIDSMQFMPGNNTKFYLYASGQAVFGTNVLYAPDRDTLVKFYGDINTTHGYMTNASVQQNLKVKGFVNATSYTRIKSSNDIGINISQWYTSGTTGSDANLLGVDTSDTVLLQSAWSAPVIEMTTDRNVTIPGRLNLIGNISMKGDGLWHYVCANGNGTIYLSSTACV